MKIPPNLPEKGEIAIDIETHDDNLKKFGPGVRRGSYIVGIAVAYGNDAWYMPFKHENGINLPEKDIKLWCLNNLCRPNQPKVGANLSYDLDFLWHWGVKITGPFYDVQIAEPLLDETRPSYSLNALSKIYLEETKADDELSQWVLQNIGSKKDAHSFIWKVPSDIVEGYAKSDALLALQIFQKQKPLLEGKNLWDLFILETELLPMLLEMRQKGVRIDTKKVARLEEEYDREIKLARERLNRIAGMEVNPNASAQISVACDKLGITYPRTQKTNAPSFTKPWMENQNHEIFEALLDIRQFEKQQTTFLKGAIETYLIEGRIHCLFHPLKNDSHGTVSGRFSSSNPNLQFIPARHPVLGPATRGLFLPEEHETWYKFDYSSIEPRVTLHYAEGNVAKDAKRILKNNPDSDVYRPMMKLLPRLDRQTIKTIYLGTAYGMGSEKLARKLGVPSHEAKKVIADFNIGLPYIRNLSKACMHRAGVVGHVTTILKRRRRFNLYEPIFSASKVTPLPQNIARARWGRVRRAYTYKAMNALIQGSSADIMKKAMLDIYKSGITDEIGVPMITCHDEVDFSIPKGKEHLANDIKDIMENTVKLDVPLFVEIEKGNSWNVAH